MKCHELSKNFTSAADMFAALKANKQQIIDMKKAAIKCSDPINLLATGAGEQAAKGEPSALTFGDFIYPVMNTTNYLDSHGDVHLNGIWDKSASEQQGKTYYVINHDLAIGKVISYPKNVEIMVKDMAWRELGKDIDGRTQALIFKAKITKATNTDALNAFQSGEPIENSIRMIYVNLGLAVNSKSMDFKEEKNLWDTHYPIIANKDVADERGYFWAVAEAKIHKEGSAVLFGSNDATPVMYDAPKFAEPPSGTRSRAADRTRVKEELNNLLLKLKQ